MKRLLQILCAGMLLIIAGCSDEQIEPRLTEDLKTSANYYWDRYFSIHLTTSFDDELTFYLDGTGGEVTVDWGDGTSETINVDGEVGFEHDYQTESDPWSGEENQQDFTIRISGDLSTITGFNFYYAGLYIHEMHFGGLTNLRTISMGMLQNGPPRINLSRNKSIEYVIVGALQRLEELTLPSTNKIRGVDIAGDNKLSTADVDRIIARVYDSVLKSPRSGFFNVSKTWYQDEDDMSLAGPPSSYSVNKLRKLKQVYGWKIVPDLN